MSELNIGTKNFTKVITLDTPGQGNACHEYQIETVSITHDTNVSVVGKISFQNGPIKEFGVNGCHNEDLIAIVIDRLQSFQSSDFKCRENELALIKLEEAMHWLNHRTQDRKKRGVEGTNNL